MAGRNSYFRIKQIKFYMCNSFFDFLNWKKVVVCTWREKRVFLVSRARKGVDSDFYIIIIYRIQIYKGVLARKFFRTLVLLDLSRNFSRCFFSIIIYIYTSEKKFGLVFLKIKSSKKVHESRWIKLDQCKKRIA